MQMELGDPPNVAGWPAYYQQPQFHELWINSDSLPKRNEFSDQMTSTGYTKNGKKIIMDVLAFTAALPNPQNPNALVADAITYLLRMPLTQQSRDKIKTDILLGTKNYHYVFLGKKGVENKVILKCDKDQDGAIYFIKKLNYISFMANAEGTTFELKLNNL